MFGDMEPLLAWKDMCGVCVWWSKLLESTRSPDQMDETKPFWQASSSGRNLWSTRPLSRLEYSKDAAQSWNDRYGQTNSLCCIRNFACLSWKAAELSDTFMSYFFPVKSQWIHREQSELNIPKTAKTYQIYPVCFTWLNISYFISQLCYIFIVLFCFLLTGE